MLNHSTLPRLISCPYLLGVGGIILFWVALYSGITFFFWFVSPENYVYLQGLWDKWKLLNIYDPCQGEDRANFTNWLFDLGIPSNEDGSLWGTSVILEPLATVINRVGNANDMLTFNNFIRSQFLMKLLIKGRIFSRGSTSCPARLVFHIL